MDIRKWNIKHRSRFEIMHIFFLNFPFGSPLPDHTCLVHVILSSLHSRYWIHTARLWNMSFASTCIFFCKLKWLQGFLTYLQLLNSLKISRHKLKQLWIIKQAADVCMYRFYFLLHCQLAKKIYRYPGITKSFNTFTEFRHLSSLHFCKVL